MFFNENVFNRPPTPLFLSVYCLTKGIKSFRLSVVSKGSSTLPLYYFSSKVCLCYWIEFVLDVPFHSEYADLEDLVHSDYMFDFVYIYMRHLEPHFPRK